MGDLNIGIDISNGDHKQFYIIFNLKFLIKGKLAPQKHINKLFNFNKHTIVHSK